MESLSPSQIRDINSLYSKMYEPVGELVERYLSEDEIRQNFNATKRGFVEIKFC